MHCTSSTDFRAQETGEKNFVQPIRQRRGRGESVGRIAAERDRHRHPLAAFVVTFAVARADLVHLPVHPGRAIVVNLHPIHAEIARAGFGIAGVHVRQGDETPAILRPAFQDRQIAQREVDRSTPTFGRSDARLPGTAASLTCFGRACSR